MTARRDAAAFSRAQRGFALLIVLWALVLVSLLILQLTEAGSAEARLAGNLRRGAVVEQLADAAFAETAFHLLDRSSAAWSVAGGTHRLEEGGGTALVTVANEAGLVDLNNASPTILAALIQALGESDTRATDITASIVAWHTPIAAEQRGPVYAPYAAAQLPYRPPLGPFESVDELGLVQGMTPALLARLRPHVTVFQNGDPVLALADPLVRRAATAAGIADAAGAGTDLGADDVVRLRVDMRLGSAHFVRTGIVELAPGDNASAYRVLAWGEGG